jgi:hypothetical protein
MTRHPYQIYSIMFSQLHEGLAAVPDQFRGIPVAAQGFNLSFDICENVYVSISVVPAQILDHACLNAVHFCLEYCGVLPKL